jgi:hypothetical protein
MRAAAQTTRSFRAAYAEGLSAERWQPDLMDSTRPYQSLFNPLHRLTTLGVAAYSSENDLAFLQKYFSAGLVAGVFFG